MVQVLVTSDPFYIAHFAIGRRAVFETHLVTVVSSQTTLGVRFMDLTEKGQLR